MTTTQSQSLTREYHGTEIPVAGVYKLDTAHSSVEFVARHLMIAKVRGGFSDVTGTITIGEVPEESTVDVTIGAASVATKDETRDGHLRSADFFDVENHPTWWFRGTGVRLLGGPRFELSGELTIRGVTKPVVLEGEFEGAGSTPWGTSAVGFTASTEIDREEFGLTYNQVLESGGVLVGKKVRVELSVEANPATPEAA